jgi:glucose-6-phosphate isomerase
VSDPRPTLSAHLSKSQTRAVEAKLAQARAARVQERVTGADATLWAPQGTPEVANRLGWLTIAQRMLAQVNDLQAFAGELRAEGCRDVVLLGMGGSSLAAEVMRRSFGVGADWPTLHVLDSTDAATVSALTRRINPQKTLFLVSSKSGGTVEPLSMWAHFWALAPAGARFAAITDPGSGLEALAREHGFRRVFAGDPAIGGRYSALSAFGMVPAALAGYDVEALLLGGAPPFGLRRGVRAGQEGGAQEDDAAWLWLGVALSALAEQGRNKLTIVDWGHTSTHPRARLASLGLWLEQLVAESTGKHGTGILPVAEEPVGDADVYGDDRVFLHVPDEGAPDAALEQAVEALAQAGHPVIELPSTGPEDLGRIFMLAELAVAVAGWGLGINPFDQPNVQQAKDATTRVLAQFEQEGSLPAVAEADDIALQVLIGEAVPPEYVAIMAYVEPSAEFDAAVAELRTAIRQGTRVTTTFGYGPRFLHSTGQFHKGGPKTGRFLQLLHDGAEDVEIPGAPYSFTTLKNAQAIGDLETLRELELPAERVRLYGSDPIRALRGLTDRIKEAL